MTLKIGNVELENNEMCIRDRYEVSKLLVR